MILGILTTSPSDAVTVDRLHAITREAPAGHFWDIRVSTFVDADDMGYTLTARLMRRVQRARPWWAFWDFPEEDHREIARDTVQVTDPPIILTLGDVFSDWQTTTALILDTLSTVHRMNILAAAEYEIRTNKPFYFTE